jgi:5'-nucleotidase
MSSLKILLDVDGILADFDSATRAYLARVHVLPFAHEDVTEMDFCKALSLPQHVQLALQAAWRRPGFCATIEPYLGSGHFVERLKSLGTVIAVTAPMQGARQWAYERELWLRHYFAIEAIISTKEKHHVMGDVLIEDSVANLLTSPCRDKILLRRPWNVRESAGLMSAYLVDDYNGAIEAVTEIISKREEK